MNLGKRHNHSASWHSLGWTARPFDLRLPVAGEVFLLTSPFIERGYRKCGVLFVGSARDAGCLPAEGIVLDIHNSAVPTHATAIGAIKRGRPRNHKTDGTIKVRAATFAHTSTKFWYSGAPAYVVESTFGANVIATGQNKRMREARTRDVRVTWLPYADSLQCSALSTSQVFENRTQC